MHNFLMADCSIDIICTCTESHQEIMHSAGSKTRLDSSRADICRLIEDAGYTPVKRNSTYSEFETVASLVTERTVLPIIEV
jgi:2-iminoacetate synthase ThiH